MLVDTCKPIKVLKIIFVIVDLKKKDIYKLPSNLKKNVYLFYIKITNHNNYQVVIKLYYNHL